MKNASEGILFYVKSYQITKERKESYFKKINIL